MFAAGHEILRQYVDAKAAQKSVYLHRCLLELHVSLHDQGVNHPAVFDVGVDSEMLCDHRTRLTEIMGRRLRKGREKTFVIGGLPPTVAGKHDSPPEGRFSGGNNKGCKTRLQRRIQSCVMAEHLTGPFTVATPGQGGRLCAITVLQVQGRSCTSEWLLRRPSSAGRVPRRGRATKSMKLGSDE